MSGAGVNYGCTMVAGSGKLGECEKLGDSFGFTVDFAV